MREIIEVVAEIILITIAYLKRKEIEVHADNDRSFYQTLMRGLFIESAPGTS